MNNEYMQSNQLHINVGKSCYMHFKPTLDRVKQTCARIRYFDTNLNIKLNGTKLSKVKSTKFLGVVIDDQLTWEPQVEYLKAKLISSIVTIKRIKPFIPKTEYEKVYNALFMSHLSYCIRVVSRTINGENIFNSKNVCAIAFWQRSLL